MPQIYVAGPLFNTHERWYLEQITARLEALGFSVFLPHRDAGLLDGAQINRSRLFADDMRGLDSCQIVVALLTGADQDSGTSVELGIAYAQGKPCFGITDDMRWLNNMIWGVCGEGKRLVKSIDDLLPLILNSGITPVRLPPED